MTAATVTEPIRARLDEVSRQIEELRRRAFELRGELRAAQRAERSPRVKSTRVVARTKLTDELVTGWEQAELSLEEIALQLGVSRQRVQQLLVARFGRSEHTRLQHRRVAIKRYRAEQARKAAAAGEYAAQPLKTCIVCGKRYRSLNRNRRLTCSPACAVMYRDIRQSLRPFVPAENKQRRWVQPNSATGRAVTAAYERNLPIFDLLDPRVKRQFTGELDPDRTLQCETCGAMFVRRDPRGANRYCSLACYRAAGIGQQNRKLAEAS